tara:strand:+ start:21211 stop:22230 length:1020 start_codon:yes stop_codon:yes gene_type:complete
MAVKKHSDLTAQADLHEPKLHKDRHAKGGVDEIKLTDINPNGAIGKLPKQNASANIEWDDDIDLNGNYAQRGPEMQIDDGQATFYFGPKDANNTFRFKRTSANTVLELTRYNGTTTNYDHISSFPPQAANHGRFELYGKGSPVLVTGSNNHRIMSSPGTWDTNLTDSTGTNTYAMINTSVCPVAGVVNGAGATNKWSKALIHTHINAGGGFQIPTKCHIVNCHVQYTLAGVPAASTTPWRLYLWSVGRSAGSDSDDYDTLDLVGWMRSSSTPHKYPAYNDIVTRTAAGQGSVDTTNAYAQGVPGSYEGDWFFFTLQTGNTTDANDNMSQIHITLNYRGV